VAIVQRAYERLILDGAKTVELRLTRTPIPPFGCIKPGERVYLKRSGGPFFARATAAGVLMLDALNPAAVDRLRRQYDRWIRGSAAHWREKRRVARYATLIWLRDVAPTTQQPRYRPQNMRAWYTLDDDADPLPPPLGATAEPTDLPIAPPEPDGTAPDAAAFEIALTAGAVRQGYVRLRDQAARFEPHEKPLCLMLRDGPTVETDVVRGRFRWRGWRRWFEARGLTADDRLRFVPRGERRFTVEPIHTDPTHGKGKAEA